jgi:hypothetical protein
VSNSLFAYIAPFSVVLWANSTEAMRAPVTIDAPGKAIVIEAPPALPRTACSFRRSICVHGGDAASSRATLEALERAWETGVVLGVPLPRAFDAYVAPEPSRSAISDRDSLRHFDYASAFSILDARANGCARDFEAARELYTASALSVAPAIDDASLRGESTALAALAVPCVAIDATSFQSHADRAIADPEVDPTPFFAWVDSELGKEPGRALTATWALAPTKTPGDDHWNAEPDVFDVLRESFKDARGVGYSFEDALAEFSVARLEMGAPVRFDWDVAWPKSARTLASPFPVSEAGATYVRIDGAGAASRLRVDASWEEHAKMRWTVVKLDAAGKPIAQWEAKAQPKATEAHLQIVDTQGAAAFVVVASNVGNWTTPFDPDEGPWEPHGWLLTIAQE